MKDESRRRFLQRGLALGGLGLLSGCQVPRMARQAAKPASLGFLGSTSPQPYYDALRQGLA